MKRLLLAALAFLCALGAVGEAHAARPTFQHAPPPAAPAGRSLEILGNIFGASDLARARCRYRGRGGSWKQADLILEYGDLYRAIIPAAEVVPPSLEYYCVGYDYFDGQAELFRSASSPGRIRVVAAEPAKGRGAGEGGSALRSQSARAPRSAPSPEAQDEGAAEPEEAPVFASEDVVSLATRQAQSVTDAPAIASAMPGEMMQELGLRTLPEVLKVVPGFETSRDVQGFHRVAIRGMRDDSAFLVLYDGHRLNSAYDARALLDLPVENAERVEVIRGPGSALYGAGAFLGVVNVVSKRRQTLEASVSGGSFGTVDGHLSGGTRLSSSDWLLFGDADFARSDGYREAIGRDAASRALELADLKREDEPAGLTDDHRLFFNVGAEARRDPREGGRSRLSARFMREDRGALVGLFDMAGRGSKLVWNALLADATHELPVPAGSLSGRLFFDQQMVDRLFQVAPSGYPLAPTVVARDGLFERTSFTAQTYGGEGSLDLALAQVHRLSLGLSLQLERLPSYLYEVNFKQGAVLDGLQEPERDPAQPLRQRLAELNSRLAFGAYAQDVWRAWDSVSLTLGARLDITRLPEVVFDSAGQVSSIGTRMVPSLNPRLGLVWEPVSSWSLKFLYGRAFRAPTIEELAQETPVSELTQGRFEGNPALSPALIDTVEVGAETSFAVAEGKLRLRGNGYMNYFTDPILALDTSGNITPLSNREKGVRVYGAEGEVRYEFGGRASTFINLSWFRATDLAAPAGFQYLTDVPQYRVNWAAQLPLNRFLSASLLVQLGAERRNNGRSQLEALRHYKIPPYTLVGAQLRTEPIAEHYELALSAQNVFDFPLVDDVPRPDANRMPGLLPREGFAAFLTARARY